MLSRLDRALSEGCVTNNGPYVQDFEAVLTRYLRVPTICFSSGMTALTAMLMAEDVRDREVILPSFTFPATPSAIIAAGGKPVFVDILPETLTIDPKDVERHITGKTAAIMPVDVYGISSVSLGLLNIANRADLPILCDACPSFGTRVMTKPSAFLSAHTYSFHATKQMAVGEGGCLSSLSPEFLAVCKRLRNFGLKDEKWYEPGINGKMTEISALIGLENMKGFPDRVIARHAVKNKLDAALSEVAGVRTIPEPKGQLVSWLYCPILIEDGAAVSRDGVVNLLADRGIQTRKYYQSCHSAQYTLPNTEYISDLIIALPCYESLTDEEIDRIKAAMLDILGPRK